MRAKKGCWTYTFRFDFNDAYKCCKHWSMAYIYRPIVQWIHFKSSKLFFFAQGLFLHDFGFPQLNLNFHSAIWSKYINWIHSAVSRFNDFFSQRFVWWSRFEIECFCCQIIILFSQFIIKSFVFLFQMCNSLIRASTKQKGSTIWWVSMRSRRLKLNLNPFSSVLHHIWKHKVLLTFCDVKLNRIDIQVSAEFNNSL